MVHASEMHTVDILSSRGEAGREIANKAEGQIPKADEEIDQNTPFFQK